MGEIAQEQVSARRAAPEMRGVEVRDDRADADVRRAEVRAMLVRLLVKLYTEKHQEALKEAA
jgi:hypothetical protein